jgi:uncharacterized protein YgbK (DUF1537 family)
VAARLGRGVAVLVCDGETDADLLALAEATAGSPVLLAGSAGLATAVARRLGGDHGAGPPRLPRPLLVVAGSPHPVTLAQVERLVATGVGATRLGSIPGADAGLPPDGTDWILAPPSETGDAGPIARADTAARLGAEARRLLADAGGAPRQPRYGTLLLTGGETAVAVCRALGATGLVLGGEIEPGLPHGRLRGGPFAGLAIVTKAGGFGEPDVLVRCREALA